MKVKALMSTEVFSLNRKDSLNLAMELMTLNHIRHIPVIDDQNQLVGILSHRDILRSAVSTFASLSKEDERALYQRIPIVEIMNDKVETIGEEDNLTTAAALMIEKNIGCLPVVNGKALVGIITEADFLKLSKFIG